MIKCATPGVLPKSSCPCIVRRKKHHVVAKMTFEKEIVYHLKIRQHITYAKIKYGRSEEKIMISP